MLDRVRTCQGLYVNQCIITIFDWLKFYGTVSHGVVTNIRR